MSHGRYSPLRLRWHDAWADLTKPDGSRFAPMIVSDWVATGKVAVAQFRHRRDPRKFAILHRSTKEPGRWQLSRFDEDGPTGDSIRDTADKALKDGLDAGRLWKLESVIDADGNQYGRPL